MGKQNVCDWQPQQPQQYFTFSLLRLKVSYTSLDRDGCVNDNRTVKQSTSPGCLSIKYFIIKCQKRRRLGMESRGASCLQKTSKFVADTSAFNWSLQDGLQMCLWFTVGWGGLHVLAPRPYWAKINSCVCVCCMRSKQTRKKHPSGKWKMHSTAWAR